MKIKTFLFIFLGFSQFLFAQEFSTLRLSNKKGGSSTAIFGNKVLFVGGTSRTDTDIVDYLNTTNFSLTSEEYGADGFTSSKVVQNDDYAVFYELGGVNLLNRQMYIYKHSTSEWWDDKYPNSSGSLRSMDNAFIENNKVHFIDGNSSGTLYVYDLVNQTWGTRASPITRSEPVIAEANGKIFFIGGKLTFPEKSDKVDVYIRATQQWESFNLTEAKSGPTPVVYGDKIVIAGGQASQLNPDNSTDLVEIIDVNDYTIEILALTGKKNNLAGVTAHNKIVFAGGSSRGAEVINMDSRTVTYHSFNTQYNLRRMTGGNVGNTMIFAGGSTVDGEGDKLHIYNALTNGWSYVDIGEPRVGIAVVSTPKRLYLAGGETDVYRRLEYDEIYVFQDLTVCNHVDTTHAVEWLWEGESISFNGQTITEAGTYMDVQQNQLDCDSLIILNVNIYSPGTIGYDQTVCRGVGIDTIKETSPSIGPDLIFSWEQSFDDITYTTVPSESNSYLLPQSVTQSTYYRRVITSLNEDGYDLTPPVLISIENQGPPKMLSLGQVSNDGSRSTSVREYYPDENFAAIPKLFMYAWSYSGTESTALSLFDFDLSQIPENAVITYASLSFYHTTGSGLEKPDNFGGANTYIERIIAPWDESTVTWNTKPEATTQGQVYVSTYDSSHKNYSDIEVTGLLEDMLSNPNESHGFSMRLRRTSPFRNLSVYSESYSDLTKHPKLNIKYFLSYDTGLNEQICHDDTYTFGNQNIASSGIYYDTLANVNGCDSIIQLDLTVIPPINFAYTYEINNGESYLFNNNYLTTPGIYLDTLVSSNGCDSFLTLDLSVLGNMGDCFLDTLNNAGEIGANNAIYSGIYHAKKALFSKGEIAASETVTFQAVEEIILQPGFHVTNGSNFNAKIADCETSQLLEYDIFQNQRNVQATLDFIPKPSILVYPNPATNYLNIQLKLPSQSEIALNLYSQTGQLMKKIISKSEIKDKGVHQFSLDTNQLSSGLYYLIGEYENGNIAKKVVLMETI